MSNRDWDEQTKADQTKTFAIEGSQGIELALVHDEEHETGRRWCAIEVWTEHSVYALDVDRVCIGVTNRDNETHDAKHKLLKARLVGGQHDDPSSVSVSQPLPLPGMDAVFEVGSAGQARLVTTSIVERVVVRVRMATIQLEPRPAKVAREERVTAKVWRRTFGH